jgi:hypothetical protein
MPGPYDFAVRKAPVVCCRLNVHRSSHPTLVTIA